MHRRPIVAALDEVSRIGASRVTVDLVCRRARLSKRYLYESFESLDGLLSVVLVEVFDRVSTVIAEAAATDVDFQTVVTTAVEAILTEFDDARVARLYRESAANPTLLAVTDQAVSRFVDQILDFILDGRDHPAAAVMQGHLIVAGTTHVVAQWLRGEIPLDRESFTHELLAAAADAVARVTASTGEHSSTIYPSDIRRHTNPRVGDTGSPER